MIKLEKLKNPIKKGDTIMLDGKEILLTNLKCKDVSNGQFLNGNGANSYDYQYKIKIDGQDVYFDVSKDSNGYEVFGLYFDKNINKDPEMYDEGVTPFLENGCNYFEMQPLYFDDLKGDECKAFSVDENKKDIGDEGFFAGFNSIPLTCIKEEIKEKPKKPEIINNTGTTTENQKIENTFKDIEQKKFDFKIKEVQKGENTYILVDNSEFNNYLANKINEFTTFSYIGTFFIFSILSFYFIKSLLGR